MHISKYYFILKRLSKRLIVRAYLSVALAIFVALIAVEISSYVPKEWAELLGNDAVDEILKILGSSMLLVATFSLSTMVAAYSAASEGVTPRAARLLMEDRESLNALSIFLGSFIYSVVSIIALSTGFYEQSERFVLFIFTVVLVAIIVWTIVGWIEKLSKLGRVHETIGQVEQVCEEALDYVGKDLAYGANVVMDESDPFEEGEDFFHFNIGYVRSIDFESLNNLAKENEVKVFVEIEAGTYLYKCRRIGKLSSKLEDNVVQEFRECFDVGSSRFFEEDPRFGFITLAEVASRALSPAVNDPGTAIDVISSMIKLLTHWDEIVLHTRVEVKYPNVYIRPFDGTVFYQDLVNPISRDGSQLLEVNVRLYKALEALENLNSRDMSECAGYWKKRVIARALCSLEFEGDVASFSSLTNYRQSDDNLNVLNQ